MFRTTEGLSEERLWRRVLSLGFVLALATALLWAPGAESSTRTTDIASGPTGKAVSNQRTPVLKVGWVGIMPNLDPSTAANAGARVANGLEQLFHIGPNGKLVPWLATKLTVPNQRQYVYTLRRGVRFWDGAELTAADVVASWEYQRRPGSVRASYFKAVDTIRATGKYTVVVRLKYKDAGWRSIPGMFFLQISQKKFIDANRTTFGLPGTLVMGTGPWRPTSLNPTSGAELVANPRYWRGRPSIDRISVKLFSNESGMALAVRSGDVDLALDVVSPTTFRATSGVRVTTNPTCATAKLAIPTQATPFNDVNVRRAVARAINRADIIAAIQGSGTPTYTLIAPSLLASLGTKAQVQAALNSVPKNAFNLTAARQELARSAYPNGFNVTMPTLQQLSGVSQVIAAQLRRIGINVTVDVMGEAAFYALVFGPADKKPFAYVTTGGCTPDPSWEDEIFIGSKAAVNIAGYAPPDVDRMIAAGRATTNSQKRLRIYTNILKRLASDVPYVPLYQEGHSYATNKFVWANHSSFWHSRPWPLDLRPR